MCKYDFAFEAARFARDCRPGRSAAELAALAAGRRASAARCDRRAAELRKRGKGWASGAAWVWAADAARDRAYAAALEAIA